MTMADRTTTALPHQTGPASGDGGTGGGEGTTAAAPPPGPSTRRRILTLLIVVLLIGIPAGYLAISADQSRDSGKEKEDKAAAEGLTDGWPSKVTRRIYDVPIPHSSHDIAYFETNSWKVSRLYVQFTTSEEGLDRFLGKIGTSRAQLDKGRVTVTPREAATVGWKIGSGPDSDWAGMVNTFPKPQPVQHITVDFEHKHHPKVYLVSTVTP
ncbi:sugar kinase [Streptomyces pathocidini]|uniref:sugar kinase n=1 Tax=Streptomyces pathocidini TaxID=1650571 RepID=UPI0033F7680A